jgi:hypothetical protein
MNNLSIINVYCEDQRETAFIILQLTHDYWKIDAHHCTLNKNINVFYACRYERRNVFCQSLPRVIVRTSLIPLSMSQNRQIYSTRK